MKAEEFKTLREALRIGRAYTRSSIEGKRSFGVNIPKGELDKQDDGDMALMDEAIALLQRYETELTKLDVRPDVREVVKVIYQWDDRTVQGVCNPAMSQTNVEIRENLIRRLLDSGLCKLSPVPSTDPLEAGDRVMTPDGPGTFVVDKNSAWKPDLLVKLDSGKSLHFYREDLLNISKFHPTMTAEDHPDKEVRKVLGREVQ